MRGAGEMRQGGEGNRESSTLSTKLGHDLHTDLLVMLLIVIGFFLGPLKMLGTSWFGYLFADGLAVLIVIIVFSRRIAHGKPLLVASPISVPLLLLGFFCTLELANPEAPFIRSVLGLRSWLLYLAFYFVGLYTLQSVRHIERLYTLLFALGSLTAAYGVYQWQAGPEAFAGWSDYYGRYANLAWAARSGGTVFRAFSTFVAAGTFGGNMGLLMLLAFGVVVSQRIKARWRMLAGTAFAVMGAGIAASGSRGPVAHLMLATILALAMMPGVRPRLSVGFKATAMAGAAVALIVFLIGPIVNERFLSIFDPQAFFWKWFGPLSVGIRIAMDHPFGMGLGYTAGVPSFILSPALRGFPGMNIDSGYGSAAAELGVVGLIVFTYFALKVGIEGLRTWKGLPPGRLRDLLLGPALFAVTYPIVSVIFQPQATLPSSIYFWLLIGMLMKAPTLQRQLDADQLLRSQVHASQ